MPLRRPLAQVFHGTWDHLNPSSPTFCSRTSRNPVTWTWKVYKSPSGLLLCTKAICCLWQPAGLSFEYYSQKCSKGHLYASPVQYSCMGSTSPTLFSISANKAAAEELTRIQHTKPEVSGLSCNRLDATSVLSLNCTLQGVSSAPSPNPRFVRDVLRPKSQLQMKT